MLQDTLSFRNQIHRRVASLYDIYDYHLSLWLHFCYNISFSTFHLLLFNPFSYSFPNLFFMQSKSRSIAFLGSKKSIYFSLRLVLAQWHWGWRAFPTPTWLLWALLVSLTPIWLGSLPSLSTTDYSQKAWKIGIMVQWKGNWESGTICCRPSSVTSYLSVLRSNWT